MFELLLIIGVVLLGLAVAASLFKAVIWLLVLPFKIVGFVLHGVFGALFLIPIAAIICLLAFLFLPVAFFAVALPILCAVACVGFLAKVIF